MNDRGEFDVARYWAGLGLLERLSEIGAALTSEDVHASLGTRSVKGIGAALSGTRDSLGESGIRLDEAVRRRQVRGRTIWTAGPRLRQARHALEHVRRRWTRLERRERHGFRYVNWIGARGLNGPRSAPPLRMRLRCWYEVVIETARRKRTVLREEGLRGDDACTATRAIDRWRKAQVQRATEPVEVREIRIAKSQPRPMPPRDPQLRMHPAANSSNRD